MVEGTHPILLFRQPIMKDTHQKVFIMMLHANFHYCLVNNELMRDFVDLENDLPQHSLQYTSLQYTVHRDFVDLENDVPQHSLQYTFSVLLCLIDAKEFIPTYLMSPKHS